MLNLFPLRRETCGSTKRTSIRFANDKKVAPFCAIVLAANCETFHEPSYPTTARRTIGTHNWMRKEKTSTNRLRFRPGLEESTSKNKKRKVHENVSHLEDYGCCSRRHGVGYRGFQLVRAERLAYFIAIPGPQSQQRQRYAQHEGWQKRPDAGGPF